MKVYTVLFFSIIELATADPKMYVICNDDVSPGLLGSNPIPWALILYRLTST